MLKPLTVWVTTNYEKFLEMGLLDHLTYLSRNPSQDKKQQLEWTWNNWFQIRKSAWQVCILSSCLFNLYVEYIMWNAVLDEFQTGIKIGRNSNNLKYEDDSTLIAESEEKLKSLSMVKEESEKIDLKFNIKKN